MTLWRCLLWHRQVNFEAKAESGKGGVLATPSPATVFQPLSLARLYEYITASITAIVIRLFIVIMLEPVLPPVLQHNHNGYPRFFQALLSD